MIQFLTLSFLYARNMPASQQSTPTCPGIAFTAGAKRGEPVMGLSFDRSLRLGVTQWKNPCGQVETYPAIRQWLKFRDELERDARGD
jgi:hypothetical protein